MSCTSSGRLGEDDSVRKLGGNVGGRVRVLLADRLPRGQPLAKALLQDTDRRRDRAVVPGAPIEIC